MFLIVGLGNPGKKYEKTRHNVGFMALDLFAEVAKIDIDRNDFKGLYGKGIIFDKEVILLKPQTFMNLSGEAVTAIVNFFKINVEDIIVIYDDMAIEPGHIRLREKGSSGGHKGIQNIIDLLGTNEIKRIRIGIGEPPFDAIDFVLSKPVGDEAIAINQAIEKAKDALVECLRNDFHHAMSKFNG